MRVGTLQIKSEARLRIRQASAAAEWNSVEVRRSSAVDCLEKCVVRAQDYCAIVVVWQTFRVATQLVWVKVLVLIVWVLEVLRCGLQAGVGCIATEFGAGIGALIRSGSGLNFNISDDSCGDGCGACDADLGQERTSG